MFTPYQMDGSLVQFRFYCSSGQGLTRVDTIKINEGYWHSIVLEWLGKNVKIIIDGTHDVLNLGNNDVFFGAEVTVMADGWEDISHRFIGCMWDLIIDGVSLPMAGSSSVAVFKNPHNIEFHRCGAYIPGTVLSSLPLSLILFLCVSQLLIFFIFISNFLLGDIIYLNNNYNQMDACDIKLLSKNKL